MEHRSDRLRGVALPELLGRDGVHRAAERGVVEREPVDANEVVERDPREPLPPTADRPAGEEPERQRHHPDRLRPRADDERRAHGDVAHGGLGGCGLPGHADPGKKGVARRRGLVEHSIATVAVVADPRGRHEHGGLAVGRSDRGDQRPRRLDAARENRLLALAGPARAADRGAREVDDRVGAVDMRGGVAPGCGSGRGRPRENDHLVPIAAQRAHERLPDVARAPADDDLHRYLSERYLSERFDRLIKAVAQTVSSAQGDR